MTSTPGSKESKAEYQRRYAQEHQEELREYYRQYHLRNREKKCAAAKAWRATHPERAAENNRNYQRSETAKHHQLLYRFGLTLEEFKAIEAAQGGLCAICKQRPAKNRLHVDHDHETGKVRGLLCGNCNRALGLLKDDADRLAAAIEYLKK